MSSDELGALMRSLGANPKDEHLQELINEVDYDGIPLRYNLISENLDYTTHIRTHYL